MAEQSILHMQPKLRLITLALGSLLLAGCASIVSKSNWPVTLSSNPSGASVMVANKQGVNIHSATTPTTVTLESDAGFFRRAQYTLTFTKPGCPTRSVTLKARMNRWYVGNIVFGGLIGILIVDPATGAMWKLDHYVHVDLASGDIAGKAQPLRIVERSAMPAAWEGHLIAVN